MIRHSLASRLVASFLSALMVLACSGPAYSCGPDFPMAVIINGIHPDLPLRLFASGRLGIIQPGWAQSYLIVCWRYLAGQPLDPKEQQSILTMWHRRWESGQSFQHTDVYSAPLEYFKYRSQVLGEPVKKDASREDFSFAENVGDDAFRNALLNLKALVNHYGKQSAQVKEWLAAQDMVFGANLARSQSDPPPTPADADALTAAHRSYQLAAAKFYAGDLEKAKQLFESLARTPNFPWKDLASYMAARSFVNAHTDKDDKSGLQSVLAYLQDLISKNPRSAYKSDLLDLCALEEGIADEPEKIMDTLVKSVQKPHGERFGNSVRDLTAMIDQFIIPTDNSAPPDEAQSYCDKYELLDWLSTFQQADGLIAYLSQKEWKDRLDERKDKAAHALERWRKTHRQAWLVAAVSANNLYDRKNKDLLAATRSIAPNSPLFLTARFYLVDACLKAGDKAGARAILQPLLARADLPPTSGNMFMQQAVCASATVDDYLKNSFETVLAETEYTDRIQLPEHWPEVEAGNAYRTCGPAIPTADLADDISHNLPLCRWTALARDTRFAPAMHNQIIAAAWIRSKLLNLDCGLDDLFIKAYPALKSQVNACRKAPPGPEKRFALACLVLNNFGISPYLGAGIPRHGGGISDWDGFGKNFWTPFALSNKKTKLELDQEDDFGFYRNQEGLYFLGSYTMQDRLIGYTSPHLVKLLSNDEKKQLAAETKTIFENNPSRIFGDAVFEWCKLHPHDPRLPHLLYSIVKLPRWCGLPQPDLKDMAHLRVESKYSRQAFLILNKQYPKDKWTQEATVWY